MLSKTQTPLEYCESMLNEVESMLRLVSSHSATHQFRYTPRQNNKDFDHAVKILSYRVSSGKDTKVPYNTTRLKFFSPNSLGPGKYSGNINP
jgi:hypothetical protein